MTFSDKLNDYIQITGCSARELSQVSGLSETVISRYRNSERLPDPSGEQLNKLADALFLLSQKKGQSCLTRQIILSELSDTLEEKNTQYNQINNNFDHLVTILRLNLTELSRYLSFDPSYLSRIRVGKRKPANAIAFADGVARFVILQCPEKENREFLLTLTQIDENELTSAPICHTKLMNWLLHGNTGSNYIGDFLTKLDQFQLDEYIASIHFDTLKVPSVPFQLPASRRYYGLEGMKQGELDFFKATVLSKTSESIFMCNDMPMTDMVKDLEWAKKWMFAIAVSLKKGLHLNMVHNIERPFDEMMLGLMSWIPLYMTGKVSPYYLSGKQNSVYCHMNYVSETVAVTGECIEGAQNNGMYYLTNNKEEVSYYRKKASLLLEKAYPLFCIYRENDAAAFLSVLGEQYSSPEERHNILSSPPIYTIPDSLLQTMLRRHEIALEDCEKIIDYVKNQKAQFGLLLMNTEVLDEICELSPEVFHEHPLKLFLSDLFYSKEIIYTYEEYLEHLNITIRKSTENVNYNVTVNKKQVFRNIQIRISGQKHVLISKTNAPVIHFDIRHPKLIHAITRFTPPMEE